MDILAQSPNPIFPACAFENRCFRNLRELVLSYFEDYYNVDGEKTMRGYTIPLDLSQYDSLHWMTEDAGLDVIAEKLDQIRSYLPSDPCNGSQVTSYGHQELSSWFAWGNEAGLYRPGEHH
jgi:hypothetical protein